MAKYGYIYAPFSGVEGADYAHTYNFYIYWEVLSQNAAKGTTRLYLSWGLKKIASNTISINTTGSAKLTAKYDETTLKNGSVSFDMRQYSVGKHKSLYNKKITVQHDAQGRCSFDVYGYIDTDISLGTSEISETIVLPIIPRDSTISATDANIGSTSIVVVGHSYGSYTHSIAVSFGDVSGWLTPAGEIADTETIMAALNIPFKLPDSFYDQIPDDISGEVTLTLTTYNNGEKIGDPSTTTFTASVDENTNAPSFTATIEDVDELALSLSGGSAIIKNLSDAKITVTGEGKNGASIASVKIEGHTLKNGTPITFVDTKSGYFAFTVTDSRGIKTIGAVGMEEIDYFAPSVSFYGNRKSQTSNDVDVTITGKFYNGSFGLSALPKSNKATVYWRARQNGGEWGEYTQLGVYDQTHSGNDIALSATLSGIDYRYAYEIEVMVQDSALSSSATITIPKGIPLYDWGENDFRFHVPLTFDDDALSKTRENLGIKDPDTGSNVATLWQNADITAEFAEQRLSIEGLSQYKGGQFTVEFAYMSDSSVDVPRVRSDSATMDDDFTHMYLINVNASNGYCFTMIRRCSIYWDTEEIGFSDCSYSSASASASATNTRNGYLIPVRIKVRMPN